MDWIKRTVSDKRLHRQRRVDPVIFGSVMAAGPVFGFSTLYLVPIRLFIGVEFDSSDVAPIVASSLWLLRTVQDVHYIFVVYGLENISKFTIGVRCLCDLECFFVACPVAEAVWSAVIRSLRVNFILRAISDSFLPCIARP